MLPVAAQWLLVNASPKQFCNTLALPDERRGLMANHFPCSTLPHGHRLYPLTPIPFRIGQIPSHRIFRALKHQSRIRCLILLVVLLRCLYPRSSCGKDVTEGQNNHSCTLSVARLVRHSRCAPFSFHPGPWALQGGGHCSDQEGNW